MRFIDGSILAIFLGHPVFRVNTLLSSWRDICSWPVRSAALPFAASSTAAAAVDMDVYWATGSEWMQPSGCANTRAGFSKLLQRRGLQSIEGRQLTTCGPLASRLQHLPIRSNGAYRQTRSTHTQSADVVRGRHLPCSRAGNLIAWSCPAFTFD